MVDGKQRRAGIPLQIRFPDDGELKARLEERAKANNRSLNAEIMWLLDVALDPSVKVLPTEEIHDKIITDLNEMVHVMWGRLEQIDEHLGIDTRPQRAAKSKRKKG